MRRLSFWQCFLLGSLVLSIMSAKRWWDLHSDLHAIEVGHGKGQMEAERALQDRLRAIFDSISEDAGLYSTGGASGSSNVSANTTEVRKQTSVTSQIPQAARAIKFRADFMCGNRAPRLPDGNAVECDPAGPQPCCSSNGWCGATQGHCHCSGCIDFRAVYEQAMKTMPTPLPRRSDGGKTVVVIIPFRDREGHLVKFKEYWRWFAKEGHGGAHNVQWEIFVIEQFDSTVFNRGWCFNVGLAVASVQTAASPEITTDFGVPYDCAVIQDIDYLPEKGVDYTSCAVPIQLSAEIDRFNWKTPYLESAGGIVGMNQSHWYKINGFSNDYFGWGGEDDELHHRLRLNRLLLGDCYPFCKENDPRKGRAGSSIKRPRPGAGRFSGEYMHSANHTKRITDCEAYKKNLVLLDEIRRGGSRWRTDGMTNLVFRILAYDVDKSDQEQYGITYHHVKVRRGKTDFSLPQVTLMVSSDFCGPVNDTVVFTKARIASNWSSIPWSLAALRRRAAEVLEVSPEDCVGAAEGSFLLVDRRYNLAKVIPDPEEPRLLMLFYRWLSSPHEDAIIIADGRPPFEMIKAFGKVKALWTPPQVYTMCTSRIPKIGLKFGIKDGTQCMCGWDKLREGVFYGRKRADTEPIVICSNEKHWTQLVKRGEVCPEKWSGNEWKVNQVVWVPKGADYCVGKREGAPEESFSKMLPHPDCTGDRFAQEFSFSSLPFSRAGVPFVICVGRRPSATGVPSYILQIETGCNAGIFSEVWRFPAVRDDGMGPDKDTVCVGRASEDSSIGDALKLGRGCGREKFTFRLPSTGGGGNISQLNNTSASAENLHLICSGPLLLLRSGKKNKAIGMGDECGRVVKKDVAFNLPTAFDIAASVPHPERAISSSWERPLFTLVHEEDPCAGFFCDHILRDR